MQNTTTAAADKAGLPAIDKHLEQGSAISGGPRDAIEALEQFARDNAMTDKQVVHTCSPGDGVSQGDVNVVYLGDGDISVVARALSRVRAVMARQLSLPLERHGLFQDGNPDAQVAPGDRAGSRHVIRDIDSHRVYGLKPAHPLVGPILRTKQGFTLEHPEHADWEFREPGWYVITYQRAASQTDGELRPTLD